MKKIIITIVLIALLFGTASAFNLKNLEGQTFTSQQFADQNWLDQKYGFNCPKYQVLGQGKAIVHQCWFYRPNYNQTQNNWIVKKDFKEFQISLSPFYNCKDLKYSNPQCKKYHVNTEIKPRVIAFKQKMGNAYNAKAIEIIQQYKAEAQKIDWNLTEEEIDE